MDASNKTLTECYDWARRLVEEKYRLRLEELAQEMADDVTGFGAQPIVERDRGYTEGPDHIAALAVLSAMIDTSLRLEISMAGLKAMDKAGRELGLA